jgi:class 3 adenylate cyclase
MDLDSAFTRLGAVPELDGALLGRLRPWFEAASDAELFRINLARWAPAWSVALPAAITHFLHLTRAGVTEMSWEAHCPRCNAVLAREAALAQVRSGHWCVACLRDIEVRLDDHLEVTFTVARAIRELTGRPAYEQPARVLVFAEVEVATGTRTDVPLSVGTTAQIRLMTWPPTTVTAVPTAPVADQPVVRFRGGEAVSLPASLPTGDFVLAIVNEGPDLRTVLLEDHDMPEYTAAELPAPRLSGLEVASMPAFRALFGAETLARHESLAVRDVTLVFTDIERSTELYQRIGDVAAYALVRGHFDIVFAMVTAHHGTVIKTIGDSVMASFIRPTDAVAAFIAVQRAFAELAAEAAGGLALRLRAAIHRGPVIAVSLNDRLDFFGTTVNQTARMEAECAPGEVIVSDAVRSSLAGDAELAGCEVLSEVRELGGLPGAYRVHRIRLAVARP